MAMLESLEELRVFTQVVESGSLTAAARALGLPANTVSRRLAALEERIDAKLLNRSTRSQSLTEAGRMFVGRARRILDEVEDAEQLLRREQHELSGTIRISVISAMSVDVLRAVRALMQQHQGLRVQLRTHERVANPIAEGLDVALVGGAIADSALVARKLREVRPVLAASLEYLQARGVPRGPRDLADHDIVGYPDESQWTLVDRRGTEHPTPIDVRLELDASRTMADALTEGLGIGRIAPRMLRLGGNLQRVLPRFTLRTFPLYAVYPHSGQRSARVKAVVDALEVALAED